MSASKMHADEVENDAAMVRRLLATQFPHWADLPLVRVRLGGTVYALYRLGEEMVVRLPLREKYLAELEKEREWLPRFAPLLPLAIPTPLARGAPGDGYPLPWSIYTWLPGADAATVPVEDQHQAARDLAHFITALQRIDPTGGPPPGAHNYFRGVPLRQRDAPVRAACTQLQAMPEQGSTSGLIAGLDLQAASSAWDSALRADVWAGSPVWIHGDLLPMNLVVNNGCLSAVIDWGALAVGDPAGDLIVAWRFLDAAARQVFRESLEVDDATWARGRGWALSTALIELPYYHRTNPLLATNSRRSIDEVVADFRSEG